jgi:hypothetical protein
MSETLDLFSILKDINLIKSYKLHKNPDFQKQYNEFMINRFFSMNPETVFEANFLNMYNKIPKHAKYLFLCDIIEKKDRFLKYIKADKESEDAKMVKHIQDVYSVNKDIASDILKTIDEDEKKLIKQAYEGKKVRKR